MCYIILISYVSLFLLFTSVGKTDFLGKWHSMVLRKRAMSLILKRVMLWHVDDRGISSVANFKR